MEIDPKDYNEDYFRSRFRIEWNSSILGRNGVVPLSFNEFPQSGIQIMWKVGEGKENEALEGDAVDIEVDVVRLDSEKRDFEAFFDIKSDELNAIYFVEGKTHFMFDQSETNKKISFRVQFLTKGHYDFMLRFRDVEGKMECFKSPKKFRVNK